MVLIKIKKIIVTLCGILVLHSLSFGYTGNTHQYIIEQAYELLKLETCIAYVEYDEGIYYYNEEWDPPIVKGGKDEDKFDWVYHYHLIDPPFNQTLTNAFLLIFDKTGTSTTSTHFWDADNGLYNSTFLSGEQLLIYWSFYVDNAFVKARRYLEGYEGDNPYWISKEIHADPIQEVFDYPYPQLAPPYAISEPYGINSLYQLGTTRLYQFDFEGWINGDPRGELITDPFETYFFSLDYRKNLSLNIFGRILHLLADMSVPAHAHNDEHAPRKLWLLDTWHTEYCDEYEGWLNDDDKDIDAGGFMAFPENWYWNYINVPAQKGGYIDLSQEDDPLQFIMYTVNQIADFFASDDVDGDSDLPQGSNPIIDAMYNELEVLYPPDHSIRNAHEMNNVESALIRDTVFPFIIRATAGLLEWFAQENNLTQYNIPLADTLKGYFYSYTNPVPNPDETNKEISLYYITHNPYDPLISGTIEKEYGEIIWDNSDINLVPSVLVEGYLPSWYFYRRLIIEYNYTGPLTIKIYEDGILTKESTVEYSSSNKPPIPILFSNTTEPKGIYPATQSGGYCSQVYYENYYTLKLNAPYQGDIDTWYMISIMWEEVDGTHRYDLNGTPYVQANNNGTFDIMIPQECDIPTNPPYSNMHLKLNDVEGWDNHRIICTSDAFNGLISTISYPGEILYSIYNAPTGCPSIYIDDEYFNNILPLAENREKDQFDYILLDKSTINPGKSDFQIKEDRNNKNYLDMVQLVGVVHSKEVEIGVNNANGYIFPYSTKSQIKYFTGKDSIITLTADDSLLLYLDNFNRKNSSGLAPGFPIFFVLRICGNTKC